MQPEEQLISEIPEPRHGKIRRIINSAIAQHRISRLEPFIRTLCTELLDGIGKGIGRYVVFDKAAADAVALWVVAAHTFDSFSIFPRLLVTSPEKHCGKSTLLDAIERIVPRPLSAANITAAALFRVIEAARPIVILDEADTFARDNEELRGVINAGHKRNGMIIRVVEAGGD